MSTGCPSCLSCSLLLRRRASSLIKPAMHLMRRRSKLPAFAFRNPCLYPRHCCSILFSCLLTRWRIDELVVHELQCITTHPKWSRARIPSWACSRTANRQSKALLARQTSSAARIARLIPHPIQFLEAISAASLSVHRMRTNSEQP